MFGNPFAHYLFATIGENAIAHAFANLDQFGVAHLRAHFGADWYRQTYLDVGIEGIDPFVHYMVSGWRAANNPSPRFSTSAYLQRCPDIAQNDINPFQHWVLHGRDEGGTGAQAMSPAFSSWESLSDSQRSIVEAMYSLAYHRNGQASVDSLRDEPLGTRVNFDLGGDGYDRRGLTD